MDAMEFNKIAAAVLAPTLGLLMVNWAGEIIYEPAHSDDHHDQAYAIEVESAEEEVIEVADAGPSIHELLASADPANGESLFRACGACHVVEDGQNGVGPYLYNVVGRAIGGVDGYSYSNILAEYGTEGRVWDADALDAFLEAPKSWAPGTKMSYNGMRRDTDRADMIAYLVTASGGEVSDFIKAEAPVEEPAVDVAEAVEEAAEEVVAEATEAVEAVTEEAAELAEAAEEAVTEATEEATELAEDAADAAAELTEDAAEGAESTADALTEEATEMADAAEEAAAGAAAAVTGAIAGVVEGAEEATEDATEELAQATEEAATETVQAAVEETTDALPDFMQAASAEAGARVWRQCRACHVLEEGVNRVGPSLWNVVGNDIAAVEGYSYSDALAGKEGAWTYESLNAFLESPRKWAPGTKMSFAGLRNEEDRANIIAYLEAEAQ
ncbi:MAG: cytochrome c family protein [Pseudomonadota bacterium]